MLPIYICFCRDSFGVYFFIRNLYITKLCWSHTSYSSTVQPSIEATRAGILGSLEYNIISHVSTKNLWRYKADGKTVQPFGGINVCLFGHLAAHTNRSNRTYERRDLTEGFRIFKSKPYHEHVLEPVIFICWFFQ